MGVLRVFDTSAMLPKEKILGEIPSMKRAYQTYMDLAWPAAMEGFLVSLVAAVDLLMVGGLGAASITAVGLTNQPRLIALAFINSLNVGVTAIVARRKGEEDLVSANRCLKQALLICIVLSVFVSLTAIFFAREILLFAGAQMDVLEASVTYFKIILIGNIFTSLSLTINAAQRGVGNTKISMRTNITANIVNLALNYVLIHGRLGFPRMEVKGAALATMVGCIVACGMSFASVCHRDGILNIRSYGTWKFDKKTVSGITKIGSSALAEQVFMRIGYFSFAKIVASLGTVAFAANQIAMNILNISFAIGEGFASASASLLGQTLGAKRPDLSTLYGKVGQRCAALVACLLFIICLFGRYYIVGAFSSDLDVIEKSANLMIIIAFTNLVQISALVYFGCLRGAGDTAYVAGISLVSISIFRPLISWALCYPFGLGLIGAWLGLLLDQVVRFILAYFRFASNKWQAIKL